MHPLLAVLLLAVSITSVMPVIALAQTTNAATVLLASTPAKNASGKDAVDSITLRFAEAVELMSVTVYRPTGDELAVLDTAFAPEKKMTGKDFTFPLAEVITAPGDYKISYLIATKTNTSINGFIDFTIEPKYPPPTLLSITPSDGDEVSGPVTTLTMALDSDVDLISFDLQAIKTNGDEIAVETVESLMDGSTPEKSVRKGKAFVFMLAKPVVTPGDYTIAYGYTVTNPDGSISPFTGLVNFKLK